MSREIALDTIWLRETPRLAHTEYSLEYHKDYIREKTGLDPDTTEAMQKLKRLWQIDFNWCVDNGLHGDWEKRGRTTDMGHAGYALDGNDRKEPQECPFKTVEEVWPFDPIAEYGLPDFKKQVEHYEGLVQKWKQNEPEALSTGGYYWTITEDIARGGADGFIFEPVNDFEFMVECFGQSHCLVGSCVDCRNMAFRSWDVVKASMDKTFELSKRCKGLIWAVGNHIPANVPGEMMDKYIEYLYQQLPVESGEAPGANLPQAQKLGASLKIP